MKQAENWKPLGTVSKQIAAKLIELREVQERGAATPGGETRLGNAGGVAAVIQPSGETATSRAAGLDGQELARRGEDVGGIRRAAGRPRVANDASMGNEIRDAARLRQGEGGRGKAAPHAGHLPLFHSGE